MAGSVWGVGKFVLRRVKNRWDHGHGYGDEDEERDERVARMERGPDAMPW
jgi:hypothetical protein